MSGEPLGVSGVYLGGPSERRSSGTPMLSAPIHTMVPNAAPVNGLASIFSVVAPYAAPIDTPTPADRTGNRTFQDVLAPIAAGMDTKVRVDRREICVASGPRVGPYD